MTYEVTRLTKEMAQMSPDEIAEALNNYELLGDSMPVELNTLDELPDVNWLVANNAKISNRTIGQIEKQIEKRGIYVGKKFVVRAIYGARRDR